MKTKKYIRNENGHPIGILVAREYDDKYAIGYSLCAVSKGDRFNKAKGEMIANERAQAIIDSRRQPKVPGLIKDDFRVFVDSCERYYKFEKKLLNENI